MGFVSLVFFFFWSVLSEYITGLIYRLSLSCGAVCFVALVLQSSDVGEMLEHVIDIVWPTFLRNPAQSNRVKCDVRLGLSPAWGWDTALHHLTAAPWLRRIKQPSNSRLNLTQLVMEDIDNFGKTYHS